MVFKVKQKSQSDYYDMIVSQNSTTSTAQQIKDLSPKGARGKDISARKLAAAAEASDNTYNIAFNWPYDYLSFVELVKIDAEVLYKRDETSSVVTGTTSAPLTISVGDQTVSVPTIAENSTAGKLNNELVDKLKDAKRKKETIDTSTMKQISGNKENTRKTANFKDLSALRPTTSIRASRSRRPMGDPTSRQKTKAPTKSQTKTTSKTPKGGGGKGGY